MLLESKEPLKPLIITAMNARIPINQVQFFFFFNVDGWTIYDLLKIVFFIQFSKTSY